MVLVMGLFLSVREATGPLYCAFQPFCERLWLCVTHS